MSADRPAKKPSKPQSPPSPGRTASPAIRRCPHCGAVLAEQDRKFKGGREACPRCGMVLNEGHLA